MHSMFEFPLLFIIGAIAGIVDTLAGGGGLITLPSLLMLGLPPGIAIGTNKFQACCGELNAALHFIRGGEVKLKDLFEGIVFVIIGSALGAVLLQHINPGILNKVIPFLLLAVLLYSIFFKNITAENKQKKRFFANYFYSIFGFLIGFYNGFLGPGTGSFWIAAFIFFLGFDFKKATIYGKPLNFVGDFVSLICFLFLGFVNFKIAIVMAVGQIIGSHIGARLVILKGTKFIRPVFIAMTAILTLSLFIKHFV